MNREEAINIVRKNIPHLGIGSTEMTEALKELIPELRESDDERIRQDIFKFIDEQYPKAWKAKKAKMLDWLEKQKESFIDEHPNIIYTEMGEEFAKQKEQKPTWSEEDRHAIENCEYAIKETFKDEQNPHRIGTLDWLNSLRPGREPTEEQMRALKNSAYGSYQNGDGPLLRELYDYLLKKKQP